MKLINTISLVTAMLALLPTGASSTSLNLSNGPLAIAQAPPPLTMLVMQRDSALFYEAYNDAADLDGDGIIDIRFKPSIEYFGYFDPYLCYSHNGWFFQPVAQAVDSGGVPRTCSGQWSGNWLNYMTTTRMDALRKVLYGGWRIYDGPTATLLERSYVPQTSHAWGKEYSSPADDGYTISQFTPLSSPGFGLYHIFASYSPKMNGNAPEPPMLRVLTNTSFQARHYVSIESPVINDDNECDDGTGRRECSDLNGGPAGWSPISTAAITNLSADYYRLSGSLPSNAGQFQSLISGLGPGDLCGTNVPAGLVSQAGNPFAGSGPCAANGSRYVMHATGQITFTDTTTVDLSPDAKGSAEILINGLNVVGAYSTNYQGSGPTASEQAYVFNGGVTYNIEFRYAYRTGGNEGYGYYWSTGPLAPSQRLDYIVRVLACSNASFLESNCQEYTSGTHKPVGLLHEYGENDTMFFGLLSGSYENNTSGGVLRRNISSFSDEVNPATGQFYYTQSGDPSNETGIVRTLDGIRMQPLDANYKFPECTQSGPNPNGNGNCSSWGNPLGEMVYETLRYFSGAASPTPIYDYTDGPNVQDRSSPIDLSKEDWQDPYDTYPWCSKPVQLLISDINPNYDADEIHGVYSEFHAEYQGGRTFNSETAGSELSTGFNAASHSDDVWKLEFGVQGLYLIGQSQTLVDHVPTPKTAINFSTIRGLIEQPDKEGGYYMAGLAYYAHNNDLHPIAGEQTMETFAVAMSSPKPKINIDAGGNPIVITPIGKTIEGCQTASLTVKPTNSLTEFYVDDLDTDSGSFTVYFENLEFGNDFDVDAIVEYSYQVQPDNSVDVTVNMQHTWDNSCVQHAGYVISGTSADGLYLEVTTNVGADEDYYLDTPPGVAPNTTGATGFPWEDGGAPLPTTTTRSFTPGAGSVANILENPLWYATKYGGFIDEDEDDTPDNSNPDFAATPDIEWDENNDGDPDNYFLVTNATGLSEQLAKAFERILNRSTSAAALAVNTGSIETETVIFQARFDALYWTGELLAYTLDVDSGEVAEDPSWDAGTELTNQSLASRNIISYDPQADSGIPFRWGDMSVNQQTTLNANVNGPALVRWLRGESPTAVGQPFREREKLLGDIIHSDPLFVGKSRRGYPNDWTDFTVGASSSEPEDSDPYSDYVAAKETRMPVVYVGANDGMLHGFNATINDADSGEEEIAYVPSMVYRNLYRLASPLYNTNNHYYYVDGPPKVDDVYFNSTWNTVLVGTLNKGGQGVYALNISDPSQFSEGNASDIALWEFSDEDDEDLGYAYGQVSIGRFHNGQWLVAVGNGYNNQENDGFQSSTGNGVVFLLDVETGAIVKKFDTGAGSMDDPTGQNRTNGIVSPTLIDIDGDFIIDTIYAGDLFGNIWKMDVTDNNVNQWDFPFPSGGGMESPLFSATDSSGVAQPITSPVDVGRHPYDNTQTMVYFGTGQFIETADNTASGEQTQTFYAIIDSNQPSAGISGRSELLEQDFIFETTITTGEDSVDVRISSDNVVDFDTQKGWYIDLLNPAGTDNRGERIIRKPTLRSGRIIITTFQPDDDPCNSGAGSGWLLVFNAYTGSRLEQTPLDVNNDGLYDRDDFLELPDGTMAAISGINDGNGTPSPPVIIERDGDELLALGTSSGEIVVMGSSKAAETTGRQSWRRIR